MIDAHELRLLRIIEKLLTENERISNHAIEQTNKTVELKTALESIATSALAGQFSQLGHGDCAKRAKEALAKIPA